MSLAKLNNSAMNSSYLAPHIIIETLHYNARNELLSFFKCIFTPIKQARSLEAHNTIEIRSYYYSTTKSMSYQTNMHRSIPNIPSLFAHVIVIS